MWVYVELESEDKKQERHSLAVDKRARTRQRRGKIADRFHEGPQKMNGMYERERKSEINRQSMWERKLGGRRWYQKRERKE